QGASIWSAWLAGDPGQQGAPLAGFNTPLVIQHSRGDPVVPAKWDNSAQRHHLAGRQDTLLYVFPGKEHLFSGATRDQAINRDVVFFRQFMAK
ncbi:MAG: hypothetical protein V2I48_00415, partial [Xanthomonadales bacterium]|nr:hypothetical protein [Xanthomonadales bacterium]